jgi:hypothetical protein
MPQYSLVLLGNEEHSRVVVTDGQDRRQIVRRIGERSFEICKGEADSEEDFLKKVAHAFALLTVMGSISTQGRDRINRELPGLEIC